METRLNLALINVPVVSSGTFILEDVLNFGGIAERQKIHDLQSHLQFDDPINIQFTSVSIWKSFCGHILKEKLFTKQNRSTLVEVICSVLISKLQGPMAGETIRHRCK